MPARRDPKSRIRNVFTVLGIGSRNRQSHGWTRPAPLKASGIDADIPARVLERLQGSGQAASRHVIATDMRIPFRWRPSALTQPCLHTTHGPRSGDDERRGPTQRPMLIPGCPGAATYARYVLHIFRAFFGLGAKIDPAESDVYFRLVVRCTRSKSAGLPPPAAINGCSINLRRSGLPPPERRFFCKRRLIITNA